MFDLKRQYDESENVGVRAVRFMTEGVTNVVGEFGTNETKVGSYVLCCWNGDCLMPCLLFPLFHKAFLQCTICLLSSQLLCAQFLCRICLSVL